MNSTQQSFFKDAARDLGVLLFLNLRNGGEHAVRISGKPDVRALEGFGHGYAAEYNARTAAAGRDQRGEQP